LNHAVGLISDSHFLAVDQFEAPVITDAFTAAQTYFRSVNKLHPEIKYPVLVWNYLPPSAGSIIHPHIQMLEEDSPVPVLQNRMNLCTQYFQKCKRNYFHDLIQHEKKMGERYVGGNASVEVIATYAPRGFNEIEFIVPHVSNLTSLNEKQVSDLCDILSRTLKAYKSVGVYSFNLASYSCALNENREDFWLHFKLFSRPSPTGIYTNDTGPMERMYDSWVIDSVPEKLTESMKPFFTK